MATIDQKYLDQAKALAAAGDVSGAYAALAAGGDTYAKASMGIVSSDPSLLGYVVRENWYIAYGPTVTAAKWSIVAKTHQANYLTQIQNSPDAAHPGSFVLPNTKFIENSYVSALESNGLSKDGAVDLGLNQLSQPITISLDKYIDTYLPGQSKAGFDLTLDMPDWHSILGIMYGDFGNRQIQNSQNFTTGSWQKALLNLSIAGLKGYNDYMIMQQAKIPIAAYNQFKEFNPDILFKLAKDYNWAFDNADSVLNELKAELKPLADNYHWALDNPDVIGDYIKGLLPDFLSPVKNLFNDVPAIPIRGGWGDPLVLDLNGNGIEVSKMGYGAGASTTYFDMDNDGFAERTAWIKGGDGLLALDKNSNGKIDNQGELFGNNNNVADGFTNLKTLDSNNDNKITSADAQFANLRVWIDANGDGKTDAGELKTLADLKITQINLAATMLTGVTNNENTVAATSSFVMNGSTKTISEVWFRNDTTDTHYTGDVTLDVRTLFLPTLKGFGNLKDLHVAMSQDSALLTMVQNLVNNWSTKKFENPTALDNEIKAILYKWAGVDTVVDGSRGTFIDAKILTFVETLTGSAYGSHSTLGFTQPSDGVHVPPVMNAFEIAFDSFKAQLLTQAGASSLFTTVPTYNLATGELTSGVLSTTAISALKTEALTLTSSARDSFWNSVSEYILNVKDKAALSTTETDALNSAIVASGTGQTWESISTNVLSQYSATYRATELSDEVVGVQGNDNLSGLGGDDIMNGRTGNDYLYGGSGDDTYVFKVGDGQDSILEESGTDTILMGTGITAANIRFERYNSTDLNIYYGTSDKITINYHFYDEVYGSDTTYEIETLKFADGSTIDLKGGLTFTGTTLGNSVIGTSLSDTLLGLAGDDNLNALAGNDTLNGGAGNDTLYGGDGNDILNGGEGDDYIYGDDGNDTATYAGNASAVTVNLSLTSSQNTIGAGTDILVSIENLIGSSYSDTLTGDANANTIEGGLGNDILNGGAGIDTASYSSATSGVTVNLATTTAQNTIAAGTDTITGFENLIGSSYNDTLTGDANANNIFGGNGDDIINGGAGNDILTGGNGIDTLSFVGAASAITFNMTVITSQNTGGAGTDTASGFENLIGSSYNDTLTGDANANTIEGGLGNDILNGGAGIDMVSYATATAAVTVNLALTTAQNTVGAGTDTLSNFENIFASAFNDTLTGSSATNTINGGAGNDLIIGGLGADTLTGGLGADTFQFLSTGLDATIDRITDFSTAQGDKFDVKNILVGYDAVTKAITDFVEFTTVGANTVIKVDRDGLGTTYGWQQIAQLDNVTGLTDEAALKANGNLVA